MKLDSKKITEGLVNFSTNTNVKIYYPGGDNLIGDTLDLITRLTEENERLRAEQKQAYFKWKKLADDVSDRYEQLYQEAKKSLVVDTVREMQERVYEFADGLDALSEWQIKNMIDQIAKEMTNDT